MRVRCGKRGVAGREGVRETNHKVEPSHEENEVDQQQPMLAQGHLALRDERPSDVPLCLAHGLSLAEGHRLGEGQSEQDDQHRGTRAEPEEWPPPMARGVHEAPREDRRKQIPKGIALLQHAGDDTARRLGAVLERRGGGIAVESAHGDAEQGPHGQELLVVLREACAELEDDEEDVVDDEGPFPAVAVGGDAEDGRADGAQHQHEGYAPCDVGVRLVEGLGQVADDERDGKEVEGVPCPGYERDLRARCQYGLAPRLDVLGGWGYREEEPLLLVQHRQELEGIGRLRHGRLERGEARRGIAADRHVLVVVGNRRRIAGVIVLVLTHLEAVGSRICEAYDVSLYSSRNERRWAQTQSEQSRPKDCLQLHQ